MDGEESRRLMQYVSGLKAGLPVLFGFVPVGIAYAVLASQAGFWSQPDNGRGDVRPGGRNRRDSHNDVHTESQTSDNEHMRHEPHEGNACTA